jgi:hypothetical protein
MPVIDLYLPEGALSLEAERDLAERITTLILKAEVPGPPMRTCSLAPEPWSTTRSSTRAALRPPIPATGSTPTCRRA